MDDSGLAILRNRIQCRKCKDTIEENFNFMKTCKCGAVSIDGGMSYLRRLGDRANYTELSVYATPETINYILKQRRQKSTCNIL